MREDGVFPLMAESSPPQTIVRCADEIRAIYYDGHRRLILLFLGLWTVFGGLAWLLKAEWIGAIAIGTMFVIVMNRLRRVNRAYMSLRCPACGEEARGYETRKNRIHLTCRKCGAVTPTDCGIYVMGGIREKIG